MMNDVVKSKMYESLGLEIDEDGTFTTAKEKIIEEYKKTNEADYEDLVETGTDIEETLLKILVNKIGKEDPSKDINTDPFNGTGGDLNKGNKVDLTVQTKKAKDGITTKPIDITAAAYASLPEDAKKKIMDSIDAVWEEKKSRANSAKIEKFCIDTPIRDFLLTGGSGGSVVTFQADREKVLERLKDLEGKLDKKDLENTKVFNEIKDSVTSGTPFKAYVQEAQNQKVIALRISYVDGAQTVSKVIRMDDLAIRVLNDFVGRIPLVPGMQVTEVKQNEKKDKEGKIIETGEPTFKKKFTGKSESMKQPKYIEVTAEKLEPEKAKAKYGIDTQKITVKSELKFKIIDPTSNKVQVKRVSGTVQGPFFERKELPEYIDAKLPPIAQRGSISLVIDADKEGIAKIMGASMLYGIGEQLNPEMYKNIHSAVKQESSDNTQTADNI